jgi:hypothetical protein
MDRRDFLVRSAGTAAGLMAGPAALKAFASLPQNPADIPDIAPPNITNALWLASAIPNGSSTPWYNRLSSSQLTAGTNFMIGTLYNCKAYWSSNYTQTPAQLEVLASSFLGGTNYLVALGADPPHIAWAAANNNNAGYASYYEPDVGGAWYESWNITNKLNRYYFGFTQPQVYGYLYSSNPVVPATLPLPAGSYPLSFAAGQGLAYNGDNWYNALMSVAQAGYLPAKDVNLSDLPAEVRAAAASLDSIPRHWIRSGPLKYVMPEWMRKNVEFLLWVYGAVAWAADYVAANAAETETELIAFAEEVYQLAGLLVVAAGALLLFF